MEVARSAGVSPTRRLGWHISSSAPNNRSRIFGDNRSLKRVSLFKAANIWRSLLKTNEINIIDPIGDRYNRRVVKNNARVRGVMESAIAQALLSSRKHHAHHLSHIISGNQRARVREKQLTLTGAKSLMAARAYRAPAATTGRYCYLAATIQ